jgi:hypothetical protein
MGSNHPTHHHRHQKYGSADPASVAAQDRAIAFLTDRLTEDLARIWARDRPGMVAQVAVVGDLLATLASGRLPAVCELRLLLFGYGDHPAYEPGWTDLLST